MRNPLATILLTAATLHAQNPRESPHRKGPHGLEGWTRSDIVETLESQGPLPVELILARNGHVIRRITDGLFIWKFIFLPNGKQVAFETGSLHFNLSCVLVDIASGKRLAYYDCFHGIPDNAPRWLELLVNPSNAPKAGVN